MKNDFVIRKSPDGSEYHLYDYLGNDSVVTIPDGVTHINAYAFADDDHPNDSIKKIILSDSVVEAGQNAFSYCRGLTDVRWPNNPEFKFLAPSLFQGCTSLTELSIPKTVYIVLSFMMPENLKTIKLHDELTYVTQASFLYENTTRKDDIFYNSDTIKILLSNPNYKIIDGFMVNLKYKIALFYVDRNSSEVIVPDVVERISPFCFDECGYFDYGYKENAYTNTKLVPVETIMIPKYVKYIDVSAFYCCRNLKTVVYEGNSTDLTVHKEAFRDCGYMNIHELKVICKDTLPKDRKNRITNMKIERIRIIHTEIKKGNFPSTNKLRDKCRCEYSLEKLSTATISRDVEYLRNRFNAPIEYDSFRKGYYYSHEFELKF